jgi:hypothetical protein
MSRETRKAIEQSTRMPQRSESHASAPTFSRPGIGKREAKLTPPPMKLLWYRNRSAGRVAKPSNSAMLLESVRVALQSSGLKSSLA